MVATVVGTEWVWAGVGAAFPVYWAIIQVSQKDRHEKRPYNRILARPHDVLDVLRA